MMDLFEYSRPDQISKEAPLAARLRPRTLSERVRRTLKRLIYSQTWYWAWRPYYLVVDSLGLGSSITYTCRRVT